MSAPTHHQLTELMAEVRDLLDAVERGTVVDHGHGRVSTMSALGLLELAESSARDGYPRRSGLDAGGRASVLDDTGEPMPPLSDPTGEAVVESMGPDHVRRLRDKLVSGLRTARAGLLDAANAVAQAAPPPAAPGPPGCQSCARALDSRGKPLWSPVEADREASGRCWWCNDWRHAHGEDPLPALCAARGACTRITPRLVEELYRRAGRPAPRLRARPKLTAVRSA